MAKRNKHKEFFEIIKLLIAVVTMITAIYSAGALLKINNQTQKGIINAGDDNTINYTINISDYFAKTKNEAEEMIMAQEKFYSQDYHAAFQIYAKYCDSNALACINLGYLYSKGLGVESDRKQAMHYYKKSYETFEMDEGLNNYLAMVFVTPTDINEILDAIDYAYRTNDDNSMRFIASLETMFLGLDSENTYSNAAKFMNYTTEEKRERILSMLKPYYSNSIVINQSENTMVQSDFSEYTLVKQGLGFVGTKDVIIGYLEGTNTPIYKTINCYETTDYYLVIHKCVGDSNSIYEENFIKV